MYRELLGRSVNIDDRYPAQNPYIREETLDFTLDGKGPPRVCGASDGSLQTETRGRHCVASTKSYSNIDSEFCRWRGYRQMDCARGRPRTAGMATKLEFPNVDFSEMLQTGDEDVLWHPLEHESPQAETDRIYIFLAEFITPILPVRQRCSIGGEI
jgi:hypothetical protein